MAFSSKMRSFLISFALLVFCSASALAQTGTTSLHGTVLDNSRAAVAGAKVTLVNPAQGLERDATTPASGEFEFLALPPGTYVVTVEKDGFKKYEQSKLQLLVNVPNAVSVLLQVGSVSSQVEVSALTETINTTDASLGTSLFHLSLSSVVLCRTASAHLNTAPSLH